ncbi:protein Flattop homolog isoform X1 [Sitophilus oryzae]|uniref:Cilia- and flagella-associated protein 126 n=1 Tax=Sitophilus oryzae TaxID=7048 RepID=A0A6J2Y6J0_SITOR|nr:protein Flattop homolog isoform X1 [Sitophilus oryzae]
MAKHFYSYQFDMPYRPTYLRNWEVPKFYCPKPRTRHGRTQIIANTRGHILPGVPRPPCNPFGDFIGTWDMPKKITREVANQLNGMANKKAYFERCAQLAATPPSTKYQAIKKSETDQQSRDKESEKRLSEDTISLPTDTEPVIEKIICPIHDF